MNGLRIDRDTQLEPRIYLLPEGITIDADNVTLDGNGATIMGTDKTNSQGIKVFGRKHVTIKNLRVLNYYHGISIKRSSGIEISHCTITLTTEIQSNTIFLDIWKPAAEAYGGAIFLEQVTAAKIHDNDLQHQMNGILSYHCQNLEVVNNLANYNSGFGFHLYDTSDSTFANNYADYCCRYYLTDSGSHLGADATGFLIVYKSCNNIFRKNHVRLGGDGFFLAGLTPDGIDVGCNNNVFEENDASYSPNNAFEGVFSKGNIYRGNKANYSNYGFWLGFSSDCTLTNNQIHHNRQAGIAVENGMQFKVLNNDIQNNTHGILIWTRSYEFLRTVPNMNETSSDWLIERNKLIQNKKAIRIAANQDHGIRALRQEESSILPNNHIIQNNEIRDNILGIELEKTTDIQTEQNRMNNLLANLREIG
ncbi:MAG TPA: right-handed parallel beta-helix repeat-containing protein [Anaerolineales bacterium]|jgi:parallel beta-helix repeat protein|nr:right-handed parallel beta-helix repeat-containing protein [Anaerolineales bacterium]